MRLYRSISSHFEESAAYFGLALLAMTAVVAPVVLTRN